MPVMIFESDGSHGLGDWLGILNALEMNGDYRVCVWDKPGLGWSDWMVSQQRSIEDYFPQLVKIF